MQAADPYCKKDSVTSPFATGKFEEAKCEVNIESQTINPKPQTLNVCTFCKQPRNLKPQP